MFQKLVCSSPNSLNNLPKTGFAETIKTGAEYVIMAVISNIFSWISIGQTREQQLKNTAPLPGNKVVR